MVSALDAVLPMKAVTAPMPAEGEEWAYEIKWDGMRVLAVVEHGAVRLHSANGKDATGTYPELAGLVEALDGHTVLLDGEVVAFDDDGRPSFGQLQQRMHVTGPEVARRAAETPILYVVFDLLHFDGNDMFSLPYLDRRFLMGEIVEPGDHWQVPGHQIGDGESLLQATKDRGLEGVVAKRVDSTYEPGRRSAAWIKIKNLMGQELVIGGWLPGKGARSTTFGALLLGYYDAAGELRYAGRVGTGFSEAVLGEVKAALAPLARDSTPFADPLESRAAEREAHFVAPELVAQIRFTEWTQTGRIRHPAFLGLRDDKPARDVTRES
jgi:bifunctional non-homologous end joining protein LigD